MPDRRLMIVCFGAFTGPFGGNIVLALVPTLKEAFNVGVAQVLLSIPFFMMPFAICQLFSEPILDNTDKRTAIIIGLVFYALGSLCCGLSPSIWAFLLSRVVQGIGYAFVAPSLLAIIAELTTKTRRGTAMGLYGASNGAGITSGPLIAGFLAVINWRYTFFLTVAMVFSLILSFHWFFREIQFKRTGVGFRALVTSTREVFFNPLVLFLNIAGFFTFFSYIGTISFTSDALSQPPFRLQAHEIGVIQGMAGMAGIFISPFAGILVDIVGRMQTASIGFFILGFANFLFRVSESPSVFFEGMLILGTGTALVWAALLTLSVELIPEKRGTVASVFNSARFFRYAFSPLLLAHIYTYSGIDTVYLLNILFFTTGFLLVSLVPLLRDRGLNRK